MSRSNRLIVPECQSQINQMKYEIAAELGLPVSGSAQLQADSEFATELGMISASQVNEGYWGHLASRDAGRVGGNITKRLVAEAQKVLFQ